MANTWRQMLGGKFLAANAWRQMLGGKYLAANTWRQMLWAIAGFGGGRQIVPSDASPRIIGGNKRIIGGNKRVAGGDNDYEGKIKGPIDKIGPFGFLCRLELLCL